MQSFAESATPLYTGIEGGTASDKSWHVLSATNPRRLKDRLLWEIMEADRHPAQPRAVYTIFCPFTFMPSDGTSKMIAKDAFSLRMALRSYVFVQCEERPLVSRVLSWNAMYDDKAFFLRDSDRNMAQISNADMLKLISVCSEDNFNSSHLVSLKDLEVSKVTSLSGTPFERDDTQYRVLEVRRHKGGLVDLRIELTLFNVTFNDLWVTVRNVDDSRENGHLVYDMQRYLLDIFRRRVNRKETDLTRYEDNLKLQAIYDRRDLILPDGPMKRHFIALMLICSHLKHEPEGVDRFKREVLTSLDDISGLRESKAATDSRAYLHIAMYIATGNPEYRTRAKDYIQKYNPKSASLRSFITTSCKHQARKWIGNETADS